MIPARLTRDGGHPPSHPADAGPHFTYELGEVSLTFTYDGGHPFLNVLPSPTTAGT